MTRVITLSGEDWETLYLDGIKVDEGHTVNEGIDRGKYYLMFAEANNLKAKDFSFKDLTEQDDQQTQDTGSMPNNIKELTGNYED